MLQARLLYEVNRYLSDICQCSNKEAANHAYDIDEQDVVEMNNYSPRLLETVLTTTQEDLDVKVHWAYNSFREQIKGL